MTVGLRRPFSSPLRYCWLRPDRSATCSCVRPFCLRNRAKFRPTSSLISICHRWQFTYYKFINYNMYIARADGYPCAKKRKVIRSRVQECIKFNTQDQAKSSRRNRPAPDGADHITPTFHSPSDTTTGNRPRSLPSEWPRLSPRQREVLFWAAHGKSAWETGQILGLTETTVKTYIADACKRLDAQNKVHAVAISLSYGLFSL